MATFIWLNGAGREVPNTSKMVTIGADVALGNLRLPTDPYFYGDVTIHNAVVGSRYWLVNDSDYSQVLDTGVISSSEEVLSNIPSYGSPMLLHLRLRKASSSPYYKEYEAVVPHSASGAHFYVAQELDE